MLEMAVHRIEVRVYIIHIPLYNNIPFDLSCSYSLCYLAAYMCDLT